MMSYSIKVFKKASDVITNRRLAAENEQARNHQECVTISPEISVLEKEMAQCALDAPKAIGMKNNADEFIKNLMGKNLSAQKRIREILSELNLPSDYLEVKYFCKDCKDTGFVDGKMCECLKDCMKKISFEEMSDKLPVKSSTFDSFDLSYYPTEKDFETGFIPRERMQVIFNYCQSYAEDFSKNSDNILFYGETGLGKTHLSLAIAGKVSEKGYGVVYGAAQNLMNSLENEKFGKSNSDVSAEQSILNCDLLIIDDLGAEFSTHFTISALYNIINTRLLENKPVIISTNLTPAEMENRYSRRITSRIYGNYKYLIFCGKDIRQLKDSY